jgi:hypothetical protein
MTFTLSGELVFIVVLNLALVGVAWGSLREQVRHLKENQADHGEVRELVTRLDERLENMTQELKRQPQVIALCVGEAIKAALAYRAQARA